MRINSIRPNYTIPQKTVQTFKGFANTQQKEFFINDYNMSCAKILNALADGHEKDLFYCRNNSKDNNDLRAKLYIVPKGQNINSPNTKFAEYKLYRPSEEAKQQFLKETVDLIIRDPRGSAWYGLDVANKLIKERLLTDEEGLAVFLFNYLKDLHKQQTANGRYIWIRKPPTTPDN